VLRRSNTAPRRTEHHPVSEAALAPHRDSADRFDASDLKIDAEAVHAPECADAGRAEICS
jgi:hypothetical protein